MKTTNETYNVTIYLNNVLKFYKMVQNVASCIEKKMLKGIEIDRERLATSSVVGTILSEVNKYMKKYDDESLSTKARKEARYIIADEIIEAAQENIEYKKENGNN